MAQHDYVIANGTGAAVRSDINNGLAAIVSNNSGATAPSTTYAYMLWADTSTNLLKLRNGANSAWITVGDLTAANLGLAALASPTFTGTVTIPTATISTGAGIPLGSAASPTIYFTGDTNTGIYSPGADQFAITTGGTGRLFIDSSGRLGLGNSSPSSYNGSASDLVVGNHTGAHGVTICSQNNSSGYIMFADGTTGAQTYAGQITYDHTNNRLTLGTNDGTTGLTVDSSQRVGIGTTSPARLLHVSSLSSDGHIAVEAGTSNAAFIDFRINGSNKAYIGTANLLGSGTSDNLTIWNSANGYTSFGTNGTERARIDSSGRLLVGTSTSRNGGYADPAQVQIEGLNYNAAAQSIIINSNDGNAPSLNFGKSRGTSLNSSTVVQSGDRLGVIDFAGADGTSLKRGAVIEALVDGTPGANDMPGRLVFSTTADGASSPTERMRINNGGGVMIGTTNAQTGIGDLTTVTGVAFSPDGWVGGCRSSEAAGYFTRTGTDGRVINFYKGSTGVGGISVTTTATAFNTSSDYRLKENIIGISNAIERVKQLNPCRFNFIANPEQTVDGFIAHEAQQVVPEAVEGTKDEVDDNGKPIYQGIDQSKLVPLLTAALQEALAEIESLKARVTALEP